MNGKERERESKKKKKDSEIRMMVQKLGEKGDEIRKKKSQTVRLRKGFIL